MKVSEAMAYADRLTGDAVESEIKLMWLNRLEKLIYNEIYSRYEEETEDTTITDVDSRLSVPEPYSEIYPLYIALCYSMERRETEVYTNKASAFMNGYSSFADYYNRTHTPKTTNLKI